ncbi:shikimate dehydrogenase family protein [Porphyromonas macacae]|uniref:Shikimate dehydrogenase n=1 Tax=Porphyromonas macacae TaxID=28115 RepID=A0A379DK96_9PORP|nr:shikimate dehydrogenase [Porphyromonas macacae]SUB78175.1 Shikimate dehydrogenase [Porphyromonas macacae]
MKTYGLIGFPLEHSASADYFNAKFKAEGLNAEYKPFAIESLKDLSGILKQNPSLRGFNVTSPHKENILNHLSYIDPEAKLIGAVNVVKIKRGFLGRKEFWGYNTDYLAFEETIRNLDLPPFQKALILGSGGASKAVERSFKRLGIACDVVSRTPQGAQKSYHDITPEVLTSYTIIVNATPLGMQPYIDKAPEIPYHALSDNQLCYDLIYNPEKTEFLKQAEARGARIKNGLEMLILQANEAWEIWRRS